MTGLKIILALLAILLAISCIVLFYLALKMSKYYDELLEKEWEEMKSDS